MRKVADGLLSGRYAKPAPPSSESGERQQPSGVVFQAGIRPAGFKALLGRGHAEFSTMRQQDAEEFLVHLLDILRRDARKTAGGPVGGGV
jgi:ubiquitin carboxyl-terminal hydrolase 5/13